MDAFFWIYIIAVVVIFTDYKFLEENGSKF